ncbi:MAG: ABC transporter ATP-binding protein [Cyanobacteria bacterium P01_G01_bin.49]
MIEVTELTKKYDNTTAVADISFRVDQGETLGLIGTSGCGKTTTLKMLNRLIEPTSGNILMNGEDIRQRHPVKLRQGIGYVIQNTGLFPHYTVAENIAVVPRLLGWKKKKINQRTHELLDLVGLSPRQFSPRYPHELSGGQQQRVGIARALAADPPIILLDEPFGALDQITRRQIQGEFKQLESLLHKTVVLVTHDIFEAVTLCDRLCLMDKGKVQQLGTPKELIFHPKTEFVRSFFQGNQFQLELLVTSLQEILPWLPRRDTIENNLPTYSSHQSLWDVLETFEGSFAKSPYMKISASDQDEIWVATCEEILTAFYQFKNNLNH